MQFINLFENDFYALFPELFLTCAALLLLVFGVIWSTSKASGYPILVHTVAWLSVWSIFLCTWFDFTYAIFYYGMFLQHICNRRTYFSFKSHGSM